MLPILRLQKELSAYKIQDKGRMTSQKTNPIDDAAIKSFMSNHSIRDQEELKQFISQLSEIQHYERVGEHSSATLAELILREGRTLPEQLHYFFIRLPSPVFRELVIKDEELLKELRHSPLKESMQHQLLFVEHYIEKEEQLWVDSIEKEQQAILKINPPDMNSFELSNLLNTFQSLADTFERLDLLISRCLSIAWLHDISSIVERFSVHKERLYRIRHETIGYNSDPGNGLFALLKSKLGSVFDNHGNEKLSNDDPAIEGLYKLQINHPEDYVNLGLIHSGNQHNPVLLKEEVTKALASAGLLTVADLKKHYISSSSLLGDYISKSLRQN